MNKKLMALVSTAGLATTLFAGTVVAGEWNQKGDVAAKEHGGSACLFNGLDQPDEIVPADGGEGPDPETGYDDPLWSMTPAGANSDGTVRVQSGGQLIAIGFAPPGVQGIACNGHLN